MHVAWQLCSIKKIIMVTCYNYQRESTPTDQGNRSEYGEGFFSMGEGFFSMGEGFFSMGEGFFSMGEGFFSMGRGFLQYGGGVQYGEGFSMGRQ